MSHADPFRTSFAAPRVAGRWSSWIVMVVAVNGGCCFWRQQNPVSEQLVTSRQLAQQGVNELQRHNLDEANRLLAQAVRACPDDPAAHRHYADVLAERGQTAESLKQIVEAVQKAPGDTENLLRAAELHLRAGQLPQAASYAQQVIDNDPKSIEGWAVRSRIMSQGNQPRQALADAQRALRYDPRRRDMLQLSAETYRKLGDPHRALVNYQTLADTYGPGQEPAQLFVDQAQTYGQLARHDEAVRSLHEAQRRGLNTPDVLALICEAETAAGRPAAAQQAAQQALALAPNDPRYRALVERTASLPAPDTAARR
jgi:tetratricopeptide (TPR) repeat protein